MACAGSVTLASAFVLTLAAGCGSSHSAASGPGARTSAGHPAPGGAVPSAAASSSPTALSAAELRARLLTPADLPAGFTVDEDAGSADTDGRISSTDPHCRALADLMNSNGKPAGAVADADVSFTKSDLGPNVATGLASFPSAQAAQSLLDTVTSAMKACSTLTETDKDGSSYDFGVAPLEFPPTGDAATATRMSADIGGYPAQVDIVLSRVDGTLLYVANTGLGGTDSGLTQQVAQRAVAKVRAGGG